MESRDSRETEGQGFRNLSKPGLSVVVYPGWKPVSRGSIDEDTHLVWSSSGESQGEEQVWSRWPLYLHAVGCMSVIGIAVGMRSNQYDLFITQLLSYWVFSTYKGRQMRYPGVNSSAKSHGLKE